MFALDTLNAKGDIIVNVSYGTNEVLSFVISGVISKKTKNSIDEHTVYALVNAYVDYKGDGFKSDLYTTLSESYHTAKKSMFVNGLHPLPLHMAHNVLDLFDLLDVFNFVKSIFKLSPPSNLKDTFDVQLEQDKQATRIQTYLKDDYLELASLALIVKVVFLPIAEYGLVKNSDIRNNHLEYVLFEFIKTHRIFNTPPMEKLLGLVTKSVENPSNKEETIDISIIENQISRKEIPVYLLSIVVLQRLTIASIINDDHTDNLITKVFNYVNGELNGRDDMSKTIRDRKFGNDGADDVESFLELIRVPVALSSGAEEELCWALESIDIIMKQLPTKIHDVLDDDALRDGEQFVKAFNNGNIADIQVELLGILFKSVIDPRGLQYVTRNCIMNLMAIGFAYLWGMGFKHLALLLISMRDLTIGGDIHSINNVVGRERLTKEIKDGLDIISPNKRPINDTTAQNIQEEWINSASLKLTQHLWLQVASDEYVISALGSKNYRNLLTSGIRVQLAEMIIKNEELSYV